MRIALFPSAFHPHFGGVEELSRQLSHALKRGGHEVVVITNRWPRSLPAYEDFEGLHLYRLPFRVPEGGPKAHVSYRLTHANISRELLNVLAKHRTEVMHVQCISTNALYAMRAKIATGLPLIITAQGELTMDAAGLYQRPTIMNRLLPTVLAESDWITACSARTLSDLEAHVGRAFPQKSSVIFNGVDVGEFDRAEPHKANRPYVLAIGRHVPQKGFDLLLDALAKSEHIAQDVLIAGEGPERERLEQQAASLELGDRVRFFGRADRAQTRSLFKGAEFVVVPSRADEGLPVVAVEAMAAGKAVVASCTGGLPEIVVNGETGIIVPREDVAALKHAMDEMSVNPVRAKQYGAAARQAVRRVDWTSIADQYASVYSIVLEHRDCASASQTCSADAPMRA